MTAKPTERAYLADLRRLLVQRFSLSELRTICFDLGIDAESVAVGGFTNGPAKPGLVHGMLDYLEQRRRILELVAYVRATRPDLNADLAACETKLAATHPALTTGGQVALEGRAGAASRLPPFDPATLGLHQQMAAGTREPEIVWTYDLPGQPMAAPVILGGACLIASQESGRQVQGGVLRSFDLACGTLRWEHIFENMVAAGLVAASDAFVILSLQGRRGETEGRSDSDEGIAGSALVAVDERGNIRWRTDSEIHQISAPAVGGGFVVATGNRREAILLDLATGRERATAALPVDVALVAPACSREGAYIPCRTPTLLALSPDGDIRWRYDVDGVLAGVQFNQTPLVTEKLIVATLSSGVVMALSREDGGLVWEVQAGPRGKQVAAPITDGHRLYIGVRDRVIALDLATGRQQWAFQTGVYITAPPVLQGDWLCVVGHDRRLYGVARHTGEVAWQVAMSQEIKVSPAMANGGQNGPYAVVVGCTGSVTAVTYPVPAQDHETAGRWQKAADAWLVKGELRRAAMAWSSRARQLAMEVRDPAPQEAVVEQAQAWMMSVQLLEAAGAVEEAEEARRQHAVLLGLPAITVEVHHNGLVLEGWSALTFTIKNHGYGEARNLTLRLAGEYFAWQAKGRQLVNDDMLELCHLDALMSGQTHRCAATAQPLAHGESVPLGVQIAYLDRNGEPHRLDDALNVFVVKDAAQRSPATFYLGQQATLGLSASANAAPVQAPVVDLEIRIGRGPEAYSVELTLVREAGTPPQVFTGGSIPLSLAAWESSGDLAQDGQQLFAALFRDDAVRKGWHVARGHAESRKAHRRVRLRIDAGADELYQLPWELLHEDDVMLTAAEATPFSRYIPVQKPWPKPANTWPIRVLCVIANPHDLLERYSLAPLNVDLEKYIIASAFAAIDAQRIRLEFLKPPVTLERLSRAMLRGGYQWLHFVGHTRLNMRQGRVDLLLADDLGSTRAISDRLFCRMLALQGVQPQLVYLSTCHSASGPSDKSLEGLAPKLVEIGVPAVVAMQGQIPVRVAQQATRIFYAGLVDHGCVDRAMNQVRAVFLAAEVPNVADPILYMRLPSGRLWEEA